MDYALPLMQVTPPAEIRPYVEPRPFAASPEFSKLVNQVGGVSAGAQKQLGELMEKYLVSMNLPSRAQMVSMAERLQSIEGQLNEIKALLHQAHSGTSDNHPVAPKPPRTKRPPSTGGEQK